MASELKIFSIYKLHDEDRYYLLRTVRPIYSNVDESQVELAGSIELLKREQLLNHIKQVYGHPNNSIFDLIGAFQDFPIGDELHDVNGKIALDIYFIETAYGHPWVILGTADSETAFLAKLNAEEDFEAYRPFGKLNQIKVIFITENNFE